MTPTSSLLADDLVYSPVRRPRLALEGGGAGAQPTVAQL